MADRKRTRAEIEAKLATIQQTLTQGLALAANVPHDLQKRDDLRLAWAVGVFEQAIKEALRTIGPVKEVRRV